VLELGKLGETMPKELVVRTVQLAKWRWVPKEELLNVTVKSGDKVFAPTWDLVNMYKQGNMSEEEYYVEYSKIIAASQRLHKDRWLEVLNMGSVTLACYCPRDTFCHRVILAVKLIKFGQKHGVDVVYEGEV